jgi:hypothetical protein
MRVRKLRFGESADDSENFSLLYSGFVTGGNGPGPKGMEVIRREGRILDKLEAISVEIGTNEICNECGQVNQVRRVLMPGAQEIELDQPEFELLKKYFEATSWTTRVSRRIVNISDWLSSVPVEGG